MLRLSDSEETIDHSLQYNNLVRYIIIGIVVYFCRCMYIIMCC